ncbi:hypothetical protein AGABI1DRAFT_132526 [Agaricus bisporus var. burnettii JB137-S8]|uniref:Uncharacterized protein n=1 Tax=Agaricus bisporus var. burnettii (strain JB137-S8 / ATCC MYA-4627 / FGSC 10392) TaxID=597362 RepID=K5XL00_AGABU|nr:uncharacterized protein AGABI1DRAFT_132526 [Agaricus bisporus var. burnettii JB137-S8]EKM75175.1 hypothetical protein AGABI1DRAFT_132526 [Agaricus bisporus var. burnettii JB137-S8]
MAITRLELKVYSDAGHLVLSDNGWYRMRAVTPDATVPKSRELVNKLGQLDKELNAWKQYVWGLANNDLSRDDDGTSSYRRMMKALNDLKERLPPEDQTDTKSVWLSDPVHPTTDRMTQIQQAWLEVWYEAQLVTDEIKDATDAIIIKQLRLTIKIAYSNYESLGAACESYERDLKKDLLEAYNEAIHRKK